ncbi:MAG: formylglycine-generating enzyme family protein [Candidatus Rokubacteria bacterium]|nr:formylglycine-generating enzyme family protein [Candidatus Rokubacteria bacterium]
MKPEIEMVAVPAGWFWMGWADGHPGERPRHRVWVDAFAIARSPVTNAEYGAWLATTGASPPPWWADPRFSHPGQPVVGVSWHEAMAFCEWLSGEGEGPFRLPTEAEWEKAARGGIDGARYPWGDTSPPASHPDRPPAVATTPANRIGLHDLSGVCHEWCLDWASEAYYAVSPAENPRGPAHGTRRISRGGAWRHQDPWSPVAHRSSLPPHLRYSDYGFRIARGALSGGCP